MAHPRASLLNGLIVLEESVAIFCVSCGAIKPWSKGDDRKHDKRPQLSFHDGLERTAIKRPLAKRDCESVARAPTAPRGSLKGFFFHSNVMEVCVSHLHRGNFVRGGGAPPRRLLHRALLHSSTVTTFTTLRSLAAHSSEEARASFPAKRRKKPTHDNFSRENPPRRMV